MRRLRRKRDGKEIAGVCNGLAEYYNLPARNMRLAFAFVALITGLGIAAYLFLWILLPEN
ncbi:MAG: PspC domain-containing protein [Flavobacteriales bacterium]|jgi:phage shock protein PspC (stress-responsive transcriptional regulator)|tara:strand:- start:622 stop:801 length:180 start_codon:yes stop_codon:yes gene_type:complete